MCTKFRTELDENSYLPQLISADSYWGHDWSGSEPLACVLPLEEDVAEPA